MNIFKKFKASLRLREAVKQADKAHQETGHRYFVMPNGANGKLIIMDRANFRLLKRKGYLEQKLFVRDLIRECFYCTPNRDGTEELAPNIVALKKQQYYEWYGSPQKNKRNGK